MKAPARARASLGTWLLAAFLCLSAVARAETLVRAPWDRVWITAPHWAIPVLTLLVAWPLAWPVYAWRLLRPRPQVWTSTMGVLYGNLIGRGMGAACLAAGGYLPDLGGWVRAPFRTCTPVAPAELSWLTPVRLILLGALALWFFRKAVKYGVEPRHRWRRLLREGWIPLALTVMMYAAADLLAGY